MTGEIVRLAAAMPTAFDRAGLRVPPAKAGAPFGGPVARIPEARSAGK